MAFITLILGLLGLVAGIGLLFTGIARNPAVRMVSGIFAILVLFGVWLAATGILPGVALALGKVTGIGLIAAPLSGILVGTAIGQLF